MLNKPKLMLLLGMFFVGHVFAPGVEKSWEEAIVKVPGKFFTTDVKNVDVEKPLPVVIYLHGCAGITRTHDMNWASFLADQGFIVVLPDSMARQGRISNCDTRLKQSIGAFPEAYKYRQEEIGYAQSQVLASPWADKKNIFLMGFSEGGVATALSAHEGFSGRIIMGWTCTQNKRPVFDGIRAQKDSPVLAIASEDDDWRKGNGAHTKGKCSDKADGRSNFKQINIPGSEHATFGSSEAQNAVKSFLSQYRSK